MASLLISICLGVIGLSQRNAKKSIPLLTLNLILALVATANILGRLSIDLEMKRFWGSFQFAMGAVGGILLVFAYGYQNPTRPLAKWIKALLIIEPLVTLGLALTDRWHTLMRLDVHMVELDSVRYIPGSYGTWFWMDVVFGVVLYLLAASMLTQALLRTPPVYRKQVTVILVGLALPLLIFILVLTNRIQLFQAEIHVFCLAITSAFLAWGVYTRRLDSIIPFARDTLFHDTSQGILLVDPRFRILDVNSMALKLMGQTLERLAGGPLADFMVLDLRCLDMAMSADDFEMPAQKIRVNEHDLLVFFSPVKDPHACLVGWLVTLHDYTEITRLEEALAESELKYRNVAENADEGIIIIQGQLTKYVNARLAEMGGYSRDEVTGRPFADYIVPAYREKLLDQYAGRIDEQGVPDLYETALVHHSGAEVEVEISANRIEYGGAPAVVAFVRDISRRKQTERELARVQERYRDFIEQSLDGFVLLDEHAVIVGWNRAMEEISLLSRAEVLGKEYIVVMADLLAVNHPQAGLSKLTREELLTLASPAAAKSPKLLSEIVICRQDGSCRVAQQMISPLQTENGCQVGISVRDLTDLKQVELELHDSEQRFRSMADATPVMIWMLDGEGRCHYFNRAWQTFTGHPVEELLDFGWTGFCHPDDLLQMWEAIKQANQENRGFMLEFRARRTDGQYRWLLGAAAYHANVAGEVAGFTASCVDITDQKEREIELRSLTRAIEQSPVGVFITDLKGRIEYVNPRMVEMSGYCPAGILGQELSFLLSHEIAAEKYQKLWNMVSSGKEFRGEFRNQRKNGELYWVQATISGINDATGQQTHFLAIEEDITAQRQVEEAIQKQNARLEAVFNNPEVGISLVNRDAKYIFVNQQWADMLGYSSEELTRLSTDCLTYPEDVQPSRELLMALFDGQIDRYKIEKRYQRKDGSIFWGELVAIPIVGSNGCIEEGIGFITDISERRAIQEKLRESEALYRSIINASPDTITITDLMGNIRYASPIAQKMFGYDSSTELESHMLQDFLVPEERHLADQNLKRLAQGEKLGVSEYRAIRRDGMMFHFEVNGDVLKQRDGQPYGFVFVLRDISARKEMESGQHQRMQELEALRETMNDISSELELSRVLTAIVRRVLALLGAGECEVALFDPTHGKLRIVVSYNREEDYTGVEMEDGEGIMGRAIQSHRTVIIEDYATWEGRSPRFAPVHRTMICVPLFYNQELLGAISVGANPDVKVFDLRDIRMIEMFSQQAAIAIHNARLFSEVQRLAVTDSLTGVFNRRAFFDRARQEFNRSTRYNHKLSVIMLDVDHFKVINDRFGHAAGDEALRSIAEMCQSNARESDVLGRYGGEEFVILVPETGLNGALSNAQRLCDQIAARSITSERGVIRMTVSIGVAELVAGTHDLEALIDRADQALYRAKQAGRNRVAI